MAAVSVPPLAPYRVCSRLVHAMICRANGWARGHEAEREGLLGGIVQRRRSAAGPPFSWGTPSSPPHLRAVAAGLAGRQVLAEPRAQVCGAEPGAGGATGLELEGRAAAVPCRGRELMGRRPETPSTAQARSRVHNPLRAPWASPCRSASLPPCLVSPHGASTQPLGWPLGRVMMVGAPRAGWLHGGWGPRGARALAGAPGVGGWEEGGWLPQDVGRTFCAPGAGPRGQSLQLPSGEITAEPGGERAAGRERS